MQDGKLCSVLSPLYVRLYVYAYNLKRARLLFFDFKDDIGQVVHVAEREVVAPPKKTRSSRGYPYELQLDDQSEAKCAKEVSWTVAQLRSCAVGADCAMDCAISQWQSQAE